MLNSKKFTYIALGIIFFIAILFRFINLNAFPAGFHQDEASLGYNGYSLKFTGRDDNGNFLPLYIDMFGDNRPSGYHYLTIVPIIFFGLTEFATRFPGSLFGSLTVFPMFLLAYVIYKNRAVSLLSALLIALSPWHIVISRASGEAVVALFFIILGFALLLWGLTENKNKFIIWGAVLSSISYFFYHTPRVFVPLLFAGLAVFLYPLWKGRGRNFYAKILTAFIFICSVTLFLVYIVRGGTGRYSQVNVFNNFQTTFFIGQELQEDGIAHSPKLISRIVHNKVTNVLRVFTDNYFHYFSGDFLFTKGGLPIWYNVPRMGLMYIFEFPFLLIGLYALVRSKNRLNKLPILWLIIAPVVGAITMDDIPNVNRSIVMVPVLEMIVAVGFFQTANWFSEKKTMFVSLSVFLFLANIFYFSHQYFVNATVHDNWYRNNGFAGMMKIVNKNYKQYDTIIMSKYQGGIYPLILFYSKYSPSTYQKEGSPKSPDYGGFGKFFFVPQDCPSVQRTDKFPKSQKIMFVDRGDCLFNSFLDNKKVDYVNREDGTKAFRIVYE